MMEVKNRSEVINLVPGTFHWSGKVQIRGTDSEMERLGGKTLSRTRNRERRPIYIQGVLRDGRLLVL